MQLPLDNQTPFAARAQVLPGGDGEECLLLVAKATFELGRVAALAGAQLPICLGDQFRGAGPESSLLYGDDLHPPKPAVDILLEADVFAPGGRPAAVVEVNVAVGSARCRLRLHGPRQWQGGEPGAAEAFVKAPLIYELAAGGPDRLDNPVGIGASRQCGTAAHRLEWHLDNPDAPAGLGPIARHWAVRAALAGTYDATWRRERAPFLPIDFDPRFWQVAPAPLQVAEPPLGRAVALAGVNPHEIVSGRIPDLRVRAQLRQRDALAPQVVDLALDTVWIDVVQRKLVLTFRQLLALARGPSGVTSVNLEASTA